MAAESRPRIIPDSPASAAASDPEVLLASGFDRRRFLAHVGLGTASALALGASDFSLAVTDSRSAGNVSSFDPRRRDMAFQIRRDAALLASRRPPCTHFSNGEEAAYPNHIANYSKALPHNALGEVDSAAYALLLHALSTGNASDFQNVPLGGTRKLTNPRAGLAFDLEGPDSHHLSIPPAPTIAGAEAASELAELYWMALARDVHYSDYGSDSTIARAAADLSQFAAFTGSRSGGRVTAETIFRGQTAGDLVGPYLSQFLWMDIPMGTLRIPQRIQTVPFGSDHMMSYGDWLAVQNGFEPGPYPTDPTPRYIRNLRDLAEWVHVDALYQAYHQACLILLGLGAPFARGIPYVDSTKEIGFGTFGAPHILSLVTEVASRALKAVWYEKWYVHRRLRPEAYAGLVHNRLTGAANYNLSPEVLNSDAAQAVFSAYGTYLLPMANPEGSPTHPSYGAGHATVAGACVTILKAWFDGSFVLPVPVVPDLSGTQLLDYDGPPLTVANELNKLAANVAIGRNALGVHYRSDYWESLRLGEELAVGVLEEQRETYNESCTYNFTGFDGRTIRV